MNIYKRRIFFSSTPSLMRWNSWRKSDLHRRSKRLSPRSKMPRS